MHSSLKFHLKNFHPFRFLSIRAARRISKVFRFRWIAGLSRLGMTRAQIEDVQVSAMRRGRATAALCN
jgi:hypothetical protein